MYKRYRVLSGRGKNKSQSVLIGAIHILETRCRPRLDPPPIPHVTRLTNRLSPPPQFVTYRYHLFKKRYYKYKKVCITHFKCKHLIRCCKLKQFKRNFLLLSIFYLKTKGVPVVSIIFVKRIEEKNRPSNV